MRKYSGSFRHSGAYTSPGTPEYGGTVDEGSKGWSSERVPLPASGAGRRHISAAALIPFNSGRALPSKWDDAERWITSPISGHGFVNISAAQSQRHLKSKSGPLGSPGLAYLSNYSPTMDGGSVHNFMGNSPLTTGVLVPEGLSIQYDARIAEKYDSLYPGNNIDQGTIVPGMSDVLVETTFPASQGASQGDRLDRTEEEDGLISPAVSRRDMATQMSPDGSTHSSAKGRLSYSILPSSGSGLKYQVSAKDEVRDVQVDKGTSTDRDPKKQGQRKMKDSTDIENLPSPWSGTEARKNIRLQREEAKISAWENLQKAKSEAAIQKLEMKLNKIRSDSMDKILKELETSQSRAQTMRNSLLENQTPPASIFARMRSFSHYFLCHRT
ncbi:hypothetical protein F511_11647 [Dorcoceras hygrometricum]|uniref:Remorin C-terminal domain-containing protein n=1 Tax=Dorcoceras hygrometricum TaxID=472368 RepID=A0A2Z7ARV3_9LAMI|nr:hypothetical protein F511_11647 [Dorcoceras hygrometricum]